MSYIWIRGYDGSGISFVDNSVFSYKIGNKIIFTDLKTLENEVIISENDISCYCVNPGEYTFAYAELCINPKVFVCLYPSMKRMVSLEDCGKMEFYGIGFLTDDLLLTVSGIPDFRITFWEWRISKILSSATYQTLHPVRLVINPLNWKEFIIYNSNTLTCWTIECRAKNVLLVPKSVDLTAGSNKTPKQISDLFINSHGSNFMISFLANEFEEKLSKQKTIMDTISVENVIWIGIGIALIASKSAALYKLEEDGNLNLINIETKMPDDIIINEKQLLEVKLPRPTSRSIKSPDFSFVSISPEKPPLVEQVTCMAFYHDMVHSATIDGELITFLLKGNRLIKSDSVKYDDSISSLAVSSDGKILFGTKKGYIKLIHYSQNYETSVKQDIIDFVTENWIGISSFVSDWMNFVTVQKSGILNFWNIKTGKVESSINLPFECTCLACSPVKVTVAVGTSSGHLCIVDFSMSQAPIIKRKIYLHKAPLLIIHFSDGSDLIITGSSDGYVYFLAGELTLHAYIILGYTDIRGKIVSIFSFKNKDESTLVAVASNTFQASLDAANTVTFITLKKNFSSATDENYYKNRNYQLDETFIQKTSHNFITPVCDIILFSATEMLVLGYYNRSLEKISLIIPEDNIQESTNSSIAFNSVEEYFSHDLPGGKIALLSFFSIIATCNPDGRIKIANLKNLSAAPFSFMTHHAHTHGVSGFIVNSLCNYMVCIGSDCSIVCISIEYQDKEKSKYILQSLEALKVALQRTLSKIKLTSKTKKSKVRVKLPSFQMVKEFNDVNDDLTWLERRQLQIIKDDEETYSSARKSLREEIQALRTKVLHLIENNESLPEIEKLDRHEFDLDLEQQKKLFAEGQQKIDQETCKLEDEIRYNLCLQSIMEKEFWNKMIVKGKSIKAMLSNLEVDNYPIQARSQKDVEILEMVTLLRKIEKANTLPMFESKKSEAVLKSAESLEEQEEEQPSTVYGSIKMTDENVTLHGSISATLGVTNDLLYSQFELYSSHQKQTQIILLQDVCYRLKLEFNKHFDALFNQKKLEINRIKDKNLKINEFLGYLNRAEKAWEPGMSPREDPESVFIVDDSEITVEKYYTTEELAEMGKKRKDKEEKELLEKADNWRERGLKKMMGGVLEVKREAILLKELIPPAFIINKPRAEWTPEEDKIAEEFEAKLKQLNEEKENLRTILNRELKVLQREVIDHAKNFDRLLTNLYKLKMRTEMAILQEEHKIARLNMVLMLETEMEEEEKEISNEISENKKKKTLIVEEIADIKNQITVMKEEFDTLSLADRQSEKFFKKEFADISPLYNQILLKQLKKRPRGHRLITPKPAQVLNGKGQPLVLLNMCPTLIIPMIISAMDELDDEKNKPEEMDSETWNHFIKLRHRKIEGELQIKNKALLIAELQAIVQEKIVEDETIRKTNDKLNEKLFRLGEAKYKMCKNLELQMVLKQGQIEVETSSFSTDYSDCILIHRSVVEYLNAQIKALSSIKVSRLKERKNIHKAIHLLEWEHRRMQMEIEDLLTKKKEIEKFKLNRETQKYIHEKDTVAREQREINILENIILYQQQHHEQVLSKQKETVKNIKKRMKYLKKENDKLVKDIEVTNIVVQERAHLLVYGGRNIESIIAQKTYDAVMERYHLTQVIKAQTEEITHFREELFKLYKKNFPMINVQS